MVSQSIKKRSPARIRRCNRKSYWRGCYSPGFVPKRFQRKARARRMIISAILGLRSTPEPERISVTALFSSCWWFSRQSGLYPARCRAFLRAYPVRCARRRVFSIPPFISSFFLNVSRLSPRRAFPRTFRGVDLDFCAKAERRISNGNPPRIDTARAFGAQSVNNMDTCHG